MDTGWCLDPSSAYEPCVEEPCDAFLSVVARNIPAEDRTLTLWFGYPNGTKGQSSTHPFPLPNVNVAINGGSLTIYCGTSLTHNASIPNLGTVSVPFSCSECNDE